MNNVLTAPVPAVGVLSEKDIEIRRLQRVIKQQEKQINRMECTGSQRELIMQRLSEQLAVMVTAADAATEAKSDFLSKMSHEIRTPLNAVIGLSGLALKSDDMGTVKEYLGKILRSSDFLLGVINDVLDLSKIESGKMHLADSPFDFKQMLADVANIIGFKVRQKDIAFSVNTPKSLPDVVNADRQRLTQVLTNLLSNAVKFTPENGKITMTADAVPSDTPSSYDITFSVSDTGIGISPEQQSRLFKSFSQAESSTSRLYGGTGLGLAISQSIVRLMGGEISVNSALGKGAEFVFTVTLPVGVLEEETAQSDLTTADFSGKRILLAEDNEINREIVVTVLEPSGVVIDCAEDGEKAVEAFKNTCKTSNAYDLIFMDVQMPIMDGLTATRRIRELGGDIPIIAMTANVFKEDIDRCKNAGMNDHIGKPINYETLFGKLEKYLNASR
jgi:signal transduction histidine kinase/ActR/RegA family two-component response regulator